MIVSMNRRQLASWLLCSLVLAAPAAASANPILWLTGPKSADCPSPKIDDVMKDSTVQQALDEAWERSEEGTEDEHEEGGWVVQRRNINSDGSVEYWTEVVEVDGGSVSGISLGNKPRVSGGRIVASFHTHPGPAEDPGGYQNDYPSTTDLLGSAKSEVPGIIRYGSGDDTKDIAFGVAFDEGKSLSDFTGDEISYEDVFDAIHSIDEPGGMNWSCPDTAADSDVEMSGNCLTPPDGTLHFKNNGDDAVDYELQVPDGLTIVSGGSGSAAAGEEVNIELQGNCTCRCGSKESTSTKTATLDTGASTHDVSIEVTCTAVKSNCGGSSGDPHLRSFDGTRYDFQGGGEYVLFEATAGEPLVAHVRQEPVEGAVCPSVAYNTAAAIQADGHRVAVYADQEPPVWVDGAPTEVPDEGLMLDGMSVEYLDANTLLVTASGGETLQVGLGGALNIYSYMPDERMGQVRGLLGAFSGDRSDDITTRDGQMLAAPVEWLDLYRTFGDSWRISPEESLFDYADGEDTSTYTWPDFPVSPTRLEALDDETITQAQTTCEDAGVSDPGVLEDCVLDVACTGDGSYAGQHADRPIDENDEALSIAYPIFLDGWLPQGNVGNGNWTIGEDGQSVVQTTNGDPTFFVSARDYFDTRIRGRFRVATGGDDDYIGFVFGYQSPLQANGDDANDFDMFLLSWKQHNQDVAQEGFTLARVEGTISENAQFWSHSGSDAYTVLDTLYGDDLGWQDYTEHRFELVYNADRIAIWIDDVLIFDVSAQDAGMAFEPGRFGFYNYSQSDVNYYGFTSEE